MEAVMKRWEEVETEAEEEKGLLKRQFHVHINTKATANDDIQDGFSGLNNGRLEFSQTKVNSGDEEWDVSTENLSLKTEDIEKNISLPATDPPISETERERVVISMEYGQGVQELYLDRVYQKPPTQGFYCPNCKACIEKVLIQNTVREEPSVRVQPPPLDTFRCASCFSFLIPLGRVFFPALTSNEDEASTNEAKGAPEFKVPTSDPSVAPKTSEEQVNTAADSGNQTLQPAQVINDGANEASNEVADHKTRDLESNLENNIKLPDSSNHISEIPQDEQVQDGSRNKPSYWGALVGVPALVRLKKPKTDVSEDSKQQPLLEEVVVDEANTAPSASTAVDTTQAVAVQEPRSTKALEILKSLVYGGLIESIASLSIVTSSVSGGATTLNIVALSIANLIGGLFILVHHIWDLKSELPSSSNQIDTSADRYYQSLGHRKNFFLHLSVAILSFLIFGLVPPLVYGFSFYESNSTDLKLAAVAGASIICIALLAVAKAYIQRPTTYLTYFKTVFYYLSTGVVASVVAYLVGELIKKLVEKLGWFESSSSFNLILR